MPLHTHTQISLTDAFRQRSRYREQLLHRAAFAHRRLCTKKLVCPNAFTHEDTEAFTHRGFHTEAFDLVKSHFFFKFYFDRNGCEQPLVLWTGDSEQTPGGIDGATRNDPDNFCCPKNMGCEVTEIIICQLISQMQ